LVDDVIIFFDNCIVDLLADANVDVITACEQAGYEIGFTPDLKREYEQAAIHTGTSDATKALLGAILSHGRIVGIFGFDGPPFAGFDEGMFISDAQVSTLNSISTKDRGPDKIPKNRTDAHLVALADLCIVLTANKNDSHWKAAPSNRMVIQWDALKPLLDSGYGLISAMDRLLT
jgi:hypothetical protein